MKTNPAARRFVGIRLLLRCAALAVIVGMEFYFGASLAARIAQAPTLQTDCAAAPNMSFGNAMSAVR